MDRGQREKEYALERYNRDGRVLAVQNGHHHNYEQVSPYYAQPPYPAKVPIQVQLAAEKKAQRNNIKVHQNAEAVVRYHNLEKGKVREGKHAAAVAQMHQNDLHGIDLAHNHPALHQNGVVAPLDRSQNYIKQHLNLQSKFARAQSTGSQENSTARHPNNGIKNSNLTTSFDPMKDRHLWTMWRTAVNGRIVDEVRQLEKRKSELGPSPASQFEPVVPGMYGRALVAPPLKRFIKFDDESKAIADQMSCYGQGRLETSQFVYYGLPRVYVSHRK